MMNTYMKLLVVWIAALSGQQAWAQTDAAADGMPQMDHGTMDQGAMPAMDHSKMDHGRMTHGALPDTAAAQPDMNHDMSGSDEEMQGMEHGDMHMQGGSAPPDARDPHAYSDGYTLESGPYARPGPRALRMADEHNFGALLVDRLERGYANHGHSTTYDAQAWFGRDYDRLVVKAEGDVASGKLQEARTELLWGHAIAPFWDAQLGARYDSGTGPDRSWLAFGVQGLAPYWFEVDAAAYVGDRGRTALRLGAEYELLLTQRLILQPRIELNAYGKSDDERRIGSGLSEAQTGLRLRYAFTRQFAPYIGIERTGKFGRTADLARADGEKTGVTRWVAGVRFWF